MLAAEKNPTSRYYSSNCLRYLFPTLWIERRNKL